MKTKILDALVWFPDPLEKLVGLQPSLQLSKHNFHRTFSAFIKK